MILKITMIYVLMLLVAGVIYMLIREHLTTREQVRTENILALAVAVLAVGMCLEVMSLIWSLE